VLYVQRRYVTVT